MTPEDRIKQLRSDATPTEAEWLEFRSTAHRSLARRRIAAVAGGTAMMLALVGGAYAITRTSNEAPRPDLIGTPNPAETGTPEPPSDPVDRKAPMPLNQWYVEADGKLTPFAYFLYRPESPRKVLEQTIEHIPGPLAETGGTTAIPENARLIDVSFEDGTAYVALSGKAPTNEADRRMAHAQVVYTATQFQGIENASVTWSDEQGRLENREDFHDLLPQIAVEEPQGGRVDRTFTLAGIANVYEATVSYELVDDDGNVVQDGFTTATCGSGCWGTFEETIKYRGAQTDLLLRVFESSAEDGSPLHMVEVPVFFEKAE